MTSEGDAGDMSVREAFLILEIDPTEDLRAIKARYNELLQGLHPDKNPGITGLLRERLNRQTAQLVAAYKLLKIRKEVEAISLVRAAETTTNSRDGVKDKSSGSATSNRAPHDPFYDEGPTRESAQPPKPEANPSFVDFGTTGPGQSTPPIALRLLNRGGPWRRATISRQEGPFWLATKADDSASHEIGTWFFRTKTTALSPGIHEDVIDFVVDGVVVALRLRINIVRTEEAPTPGMRQEYRAYQSPAHELGRWASAHRVAIGLAGALLMVPVALYLSYTLTRSGAGYPDPPRPAAAAGLPTPIKSLYSLFSTVRVPGEPYPIRNFAGGNIDAYIVEIYSVTRKNEIVSIRLGAFGQPDLPAPQSSCIEGHAGSPNPPIKPAQVELVVSEPGHYVGIIAFPVPGKDKYVFKYACKDFLDTVYLSEIT